MPYRTASVRYNLLGVSTMAHPLPLLWVHIHQDKDKQYHDGAVNVAKRRNVTCNPPGKSGYSEAQKAVTYLECVLWVHNVLANLRRSEIALPRTS